MKGGGAGAQIVRRKDLEKDERVFERSETTVLKAEEFNRLSLAQARYNKNYDARLRKQREIINVDDHFYFRLERKNLH